MKIQASAISGYSKIRIIEVVVCLSLLAQIVISFKLWVPFQRSFPMIPAIATLDFEPGQQWDCWLVLFLILFLFLIIYSFLRRVSIAMFLILMVVLVMEDVTRLQPWTFMYALIFALTFFESKEEEKNKIIQCGILLILSGIYFWSGIQKLNKGFTIEVVPWLLEGFIKRGYLVKYSYLGWIVGIIESMMGAGLLFKKTRKFSIMVAITMHLLILFLLGPLGHNWNKVVWPWNIGLIFILLTLYASSLPSLIKVPWYKVPASVPIALCVYILPIFSFFDVWDRNISGNLYSGNIVDLEFYYNQKEEHLPGSESNVFYDDDKGEAFVCLTEWCLEELEVPVYAEERYAYSLASDFCKCVRDTGRAGIRIEQYKRFSSEKRITTISCGDLLKKSGLK